MSVAIVGCRGPDDRWLLRRDRRSGTTATQSLFIGAALAATSVGITARVFSDLRALDDRRGAHRAGRRGRGRRARPGDPDRRRAHRAPKVRSRSSTVLGIVGDRGRVPGGDGGTSVPQFAPGFFQFVDRHARSAGTVVALALAFTLAFAELADAAKLAPIVGAFVAGLALSPQLGQGAHRARAHAGGSSLHPGLLPRRSASTSMSRRSCNPRCSASPAGCSRSSRSSASCRRGRASSAHRVTSRLIGLGMMPRGEVGLIFATIGLERGRPRRRPLRVAAARGARHHDLAPPLLRWRLHQVQLTGAHGAAGRADARRGLARGSTTVWSTSPVSHPAPALDLRARSGARDRGRRRGRGAGCSTGSAR